MAKKKNSVALFEVISKGKAENVEADMSVPVWMRTPSGKDQKPTKASKPGSAKPKAGQAVFSTAGGRLLLSLNYVSCMVAVFGLVVFLSFAFWLGRATAPTGDVGEQNMAGMQPGLGGATPSQRLVSAAAPRQEGKYYMVVQTLKDSSQKSQDEAYIIRDWCAENGEPVTVGEYKGKFVVWSLRPFDRTDKQNIENQAKIIEQLGRMYFQRHRTYDFRQRHDGELDPMMLPYYKPTE